MEESKFKKWANEWVNVFNVPTGQSEVIEANDTDVDNRLYYGGAAIVILIAAWVIFSR